MKVCDHTSVGLLVRMDSDILLIERRRPPYGFALPAGHVDGRVTWEEAARSELEEEVGLSTLSLELAYEGRKNNACRRIDGNWHYWKVYRVTTKGVLRPNPDETRQVFWCPQARLRSLVQRTQKYLAGQILDREWESRPGLEPVWVELLEDIGELV
jgi:ADP-ribose pyrophosphatase YjhB (NUDIX family)